MKINGSYRFSEFGAKTRRREIAKLKEGAIHQQDIIWMKRAVSGVKRPIVADLGSGSGNCTKEIADALPQASVIGLEPNSGLLRTAQRAYSSTTNLSFRKIAPGHLLRHERSSFDLITSRLVFHHLAEPEAELAGIYDALKPGGSVWIFDLDVSSFRLVPNDRMLWRYWKKILRIREREGGKPRGGARLPGLMHKTGFRDVGYLRAEITCGPVERSCLREMFLRWTNSLAEREQAAAEKVLEAYLGRTSGRGAVCFSPFVFTLVARKPAGG